MARYYTELQHIYNLLGCDIQASGSRCFKVSCPIGRDPRDVMVAVCLAICAVVDITACCRLEVETGPVFIVVGSPRPRNWISEPLLWRH